MGKAIVEDALWAEIEPLLPPPKPRRQKNPGRKPVADRAALTGILFVLRTGLRWRDLPTGLGLGRDVLASFARLARSGSLRSAARHLVEQTQSGRPDRHLAGRRRFIINSSSWGGRKTGPNPTDRARPGSKHHIATDANGIPIAAILTGANCHDATQLLPLIDAILPLRGKPGRPLQKPQSVFADRGYDSEPHRQMEGCKFQQFMQPIVHEQPVIPPIFAI